jgi:DNA repair protein RadC
VREATTETKHFRAPSALLALAGGSKYNAVSVPCQHHRRQSPSTASIRPGGIMTTTTETTDGRTDYQPLIHDLPVNERPRERLEHYGAKALSNAELLAIMLRVGSRGQSAVSLGQQLLARYGGLRGLAKASIPELCTLNGVGPAKAVQIKAALELGRRLTIAAPEERPQITSPADAANLIMLDMSLLEQEHLWVLLLDTKNHVLNVEKIYQGSINASLIRIGELFRAAIKANCAAIIVAVPSCAWPTTPAATRRRRPRTCASRIRSSTPASSWIVRSLII